MKARSNKFWLLVLGALLALCAAAAVLLSQRTAPGTVAVITLDGTEVERIDLRTVTREYTLEFTGESGITDRVEVAPGKIRVAEATCPDQVCVHQGWIQTGVAPIVCLPNKLVITIQGEKPPEIDGVVK